MREPNILLRPGRSHPRNLPPKPAEPAELAEYVVQRVAARRAADLAGLAAKLEIIVPHFAWELTGSEDCLEILRRDACRLAAADV